MMAKRYGDVTLLPEFFDFYCGQIDVQFTHLIWQGSKAQVLETIELIKEGGEVFTYDDCLASLKQHDYASIINFHKANNEEFMAWSRAVCVYFAYRCVRNEPVAIHTCDDYNDPMFTFKTNLAIFRAKVELKFAEMTKKAEEEAKRAEKALEDEEARKPVSKAKPKVAKAPSAIEKQRNETREANKRRDLENKARARHYQSTGVNVVSPGDAKKQAKSGQKKA